MTTQQVPAAVEQWAVSRIKELEQQHAELLAALKAIKTAFDTRAFESYGHEVVSADFEAAEDRAFNHYQGDVFDLVKNSEPFDMMLAHPPCTYLCSSGLHWNTRGVMVEGRPRAELTEEALEFVRRLMELPIKHKALENPIR